MSRVVWSTTLVLSQRRWLVLMGRLARRLTWNSVTSLWGGVEERCHTGNAAEPLGNGLAVGPASTSC